MPLKRMTANPVKPARHRAGKNTGADSSSDSDSSSEGDEPSKPAVPPPPKAASAGRITSHLGKVDLNAQRKKEAEAAEKKRQAAEEADRLATEQGFVTAEESEGEDDEDDDDDDDDDGSSSGDESSSEEEEEEAPRRLMMRPKFIPKKMRNNDTDQLEAAEEARQMAEEAARKKRADELVEEQIRKDLAARAAGKKHWDDEENEDSGVDTTDDLDPEAEEAAWRVRELKRLKRARTEIEEREKDLAEVERRRNLTEEERQAEDESFLAKQKAEKDGKGKMGFMQKYYHKGAFYQEEAGAAGLLQRELMGARIQDDVRNREALPQYLQQRDMTKLGRKGGTKYRDMRTEDTGSWGRLDDDGRGRRREEGKVFDGGDDRFRPDDDRFRRDDRGAKGANATPLGVKKRGRMDGRDDDDRGDGHRDQGESRYQPRDSRGKKTSPRSRSRSRSRSPRRERDEDRARKRRSVSRGEVYESDKRRRVGV